MPCCRALQIIVSVAEHHSNMVPWQLIAAKTGAVLKHVELTKDSQCLDMTVGGSLFHVPPCVPSCCCPSSVENFACLPCCTHCSPCQALIAHPQPRSSHINPHQPRCSQLFSSSQLSRFLFLMRSTTSPSWDHAPSSWHWSMCQTCWAKSLTPRMSWRRLTRYERSVSRGVIGMTGLSQGVPCVLVVRQM